MAAPARQDRDHDDDLAVLEAMLEHGPCIVMVVDADCRILSINRVPSGLSKEDVLGTSCLDYVNPDSHETVRHAVGQVLEHGKPVAYEIGARGPHGAPAWYSSHVLPVRLRSGAPRVLLVTEDITERRRLEQAAARGSALLQSVIDTTDDSVFVRDLQGRYVVANQAGARLIHRQPGDVLGKTDRELFPDELAQAVEDDDRRLLATGQNETSDWTVQLPDGSVRTYHSTKGPLRDGAGQVIGIYGIARDITDILQREEAQREAIQQSQRMLDVALAGGEFGAWAADLVTGEAWHDERWLLLTGYAQGEAVRTMADWQALIHPEDRARLADAIRAHEDGETRMLECEFRLRHRQGHWIWVITRGKVTRDASGRPLRAAGTMADISERKRVMTEGTALLKQLETLLTGLDRRDRTNAEPVPLSRRSREVLQLMADGLTAAAIAQRLGISKDTVDTHRRNVMHRLGLRNKAELIRYAVEHGITSSAPHRG